MVGMINLALTQQLDQYGEPLAGGQLYIIQAGTISTPQNPYQDTGLSILMPNPITLDAMGRIPQFFLADGYVKVRLQDVNGVVKFTQDNLLVIGPSAGGGGGGGGTVDPTTLLQTGDIKIRYDTAILTGFVRCNGKTIGSASSGATELADPTAQALFNFLWLKDASLVVSPGGRGASGAADWAANKTIALPDARARSLTALADMGNTDVGLLANVTFAHGGPTQLGAYAGSYYRQIPVGALPAHQHSVYLHDPGHNHTTTPASTVIAPSNIYQYYAGGAQGGQGGTWSINTNVTGMTIGSVPGTANDNLTTNTGAGGSMDWSNPFLLLTVYIKL